MRRTLVAGLNLVGAVLLAGCSLFASGERAATADSPEQAFARLKSALEARDWGAVYDAAASPSTVMQFNADFEKVKRTLVEKQGAEMFAKSVLGVSKEEYLVMTTRDFFIKTSENSGTVGNLLVAIPAPESIQNAKILEKKVEDDEATLTVELAEGRRPLELFRERGRWYFQLIDD